MLLSVKATALEAAITDFAPAVGPRTAVVPFLNGMAHLAVLSKRLRVEVELELRARERPPAAMLLSWGFPTRRFASSLP